MRDIYITSMKLDWDERGIGRPVVLLPANPGDRRDFDGVTAALGRDHRVIRIDWPGYGGSPPPSPPSSASAMLFADMLARFATEVELRGAVLVGNSVGGYAALRLALAEPERVGALVLVDTGGFTRHNVATRAFTWLKGREWVTRLIGPLFTRAYLRRRNEIVDAMIARADAARGVPSRVAVDAAVWRSFLHPDHNLRERVGGLTVPTLLVWGQRDPVLPPEKDGREARRCLPHARWAELDTGHCVFAEDPDRFLAVVLEFLAELPAWKQAA
jgi:pimeloyl-ACP methyl ester carboxylesterase